MKNFFYIRHSVKNRPDGRNDSTISVYGVRKNKPVLLQANVRIDRRDDRQAACDIISESVKKWNKVPTFEIRNLPSHASVSPDGSQVRFTSGWQASWAGYLLHCGRIELQEVR